MLPNTIPFRPSLLKTWQTPLILSAGLLLIALVAQLAGSDTLGTTITEMMIRVVIVIGLYIFVGNSGVMSFGHIGFMCIGAYAAAWLTADPVFKQVMLSGLPTTLRDNQYPFAVAMIAAMVLPAGVAVCLGAAIMRLTGIACSIATFAFLIIVNSVYSNWDSVTGGVSSITGIPSVVGPWVSVAVSVLAVFVAFGFQVSRVGLMLKATRDDPVAAAASGVSLVRVRLIAFVLSGAVVGAGGGLYAHFLGVLTVDPFYLDLSFIAIAMLVVGGISSLSGAVTGVVSVTIIIELLRALERGNGPFTLPAGSQEVGLGIVMALVLVIRPMGISNGREFILGLRKPKPHQQLQEITAPTR